MDTILYIYGKKDIKEPLVEAVRQDTFMLVKIAMYVEPLRWFQLQLYKKKARPEIPEIKTLKQLGWEWFMPKRVEERRNIRAWKRERNQYEQLLDLLEERNDTQMEKMIGDLVKELMPYVDENSGCYCIYEEGVKDVLFGDNQIGKVWEKMWKAEEFTFYAERPWVQYLIPQAAHYHFVVLGEASCIPEILRQCADKMKSLRWILDEQYAETHSEELEDFAENFYQEYGLAVSMEQVHGENGFRKMQLVCKEPANILDFSGEDMISTAEVAKGSIWLDMQSSEEKCRRFTQRDTGIQYLSLREKCRHMQKKSFCLDTTDKNEYNT